MVPTRLTLEEAKAEAAKFGGSWRQQRLVTHLLFNLGTDVSMVDLQVHVYARPTKPALEVLYMMLSRARMAAKQRKLPYVIVRTREDHEGPLRYRIERQGEEREEARAEEDDGDEEAG